MISKIIKLASHPIKVFLFKKKWRKNNTHNFTTISNDINGYCKVGKYTYGVIHMPYYVSKLIIGSFCSIGDNVTFIAGGEHYTNHFSTYPFCAKVLNCQEPGGTTKGDIIIEDDVWIGYGATILSGVKIGQGAIIGASSTVSKNVPPYAVYVGNKVIKYRFPQEYIDRMLCFDFSSLTNEDIKTYKNYLYSEIDESFFNTKFYKEHLLHK